MNIKSLFIANAVIALLFGSGFVFTPASLVALYGGNLSSSGLYIAQLFGAAAIGFGILTWSARNVGASDALQSILLALYISSALGFSLSLMAQLSGVVNDLGWSTVVIYLLLTIGFGYFKFMKSSSS